MEINIPTGQNILRHTAIRYVNKGFVHITDNNPPLKSNYPLTPAGRCGCQIVNMADGDKMPDNDEENSSVQDEIE